jgi:hypothetical protein
MNLSICKKNFYDSLEIILISLIKKIASKKKDKIKYSSKKWKNN